MAFEAYLTAGVADSRPATRRRLTVIGSLALHGLALVVAVVHSYWHVDELTMQAAKIVLAWPSPPPADPPRLEGGKRDHQPPHGRRPHPAAEAPARPAEIVQPGPALDGPGPETGPPGQGSGTDDGPGDPAPSFLPPTVARGRLAIDPQEAAHRPHLPPALARAGMTAWVLLKVCVQIDGSIASVNALKASDPAVQPAVVEAVHTWRYHPYTLDGRPVPFCTTLRYELGTS
jgi:hypothetical protein